MNIISSSHGDTSDKVNLNNRLFYIEWLSIIGDYSKDFYNRMNSEELERMYGEVLEDRGK